MGHDIPVGHELELFMCFSNESRRNRMFWVADLNRISNQAYHKYHISLVVDDLILHA